MDYSRLIPETAPEDLFACIEKECGRFRKGVLSYRAASHEEAEAAGYCEDFGGDYRRDRKKRPALLWCSECGRESVAEWISAKSCHGYGCYFEQCGGVDRRTAGSCCHALRDRSGGEDRRQ